MKAASPLYENDGSVVAPPQVIPQIDATNFVNKGVMSLNFQGTGQNLQYLETADTLNFTNTGYMIANTGFKFDTFAGGPGGNGSRRQAANWNNSGNVFAGPTNSIVTVSFFQFLFQQESALLQVWSTNIVNQGTVGLASDGLITLTGKNIDLTRGHLAGAGSFGFYDNFWGIGTETNGSDFYDTAFAISSIEPVTFPQGNFFAEVFAIAPNIYIWTNQFILGTNVQNVIQAVFVDSTDTNVISNVAFDTSFGNFSVPTIQIQALVTNSFGQQFTNELYIQDGFAVIGRNQRLLNDGFYGIPPVSVNTFMPNNYAYATAFNGFDQLDPSNSDLITTPIDYQGSNQFSMFELQLSPLSSRPFPEVTYSTITNVPGRVEINAQSALNLERTRIDSFNYASISSTNHFIGSTNAQIVVPFSSFNLGSTNGSMVISNLLAPVLPRLNGFVDLYSARWVTTNAAGETNLWFTTIVNPSIQPYFPSTIKDMTLRSTNLVIADTLNVTNNLLLDTERLTLSSNAPGALSLNGVIFSQSTNIVWSGSLPRLNYLTNNGEIVVQNAIYFAGTRHSPYFDTAFEEPYQAMVNHGAIGAQGIRVWANYFETTGSSMIFNDAYFFNFGSGSMDAVYGPLEIYAVNRGLFANGILEADLAGVTLGGGDLTISNMTILSALDITLQPTNSITDGGIVALNTWQLTGGFNLVTKPPVGDLLGTTVIITVTNFFEESRSFWAGENRGNSNSGFLNNVAVGHLVLDGQGFDTLFSFYGMGDNNAIYIDLLELDNFATNNVGGTNFTSLNINSNMTVYFAGALAGGVDISSALNGANGGHLVWVPTFTGKISSKVITHAPPQTGGNLNAGVKMEKAGVQKAMISWQAAAHSTNYLYSCTNLVNPQWTLLTNFVQGSVGNVFTFGDTANTNGSVYYKIRVDPPKP